MKKHLLLLTFVLMSGFAFAQNREIVQATSKDNLADKVSTQMQYIFPDFTLGEVYYKFSSGGSGKMNYNMLLGEMQFIDPNNRVLALANVEDVLMVKINSRTFYPYKSKEFTEELLSTGKVQLRVRRKGNAAAHSKNVAYGGQSSVSSVTSYNSIDDGNRRYNLNVTEGVLITLDNFYYLVSGNDKYTLIKGVKTFTKQFPKHKAQIEEFVKEHGTRFDNEDDLKALTEYCSKL